MTFSIVSQIRLELLILLSNWFFLINATFFVFIIDMEGNNLYLDEGVWILFRFDQNLNDCVVNAHIFNTRKIYRQKDLLSATGLIENEHLKQ